jgi:hypothetical protein
VVTALGLDTELASGGGTVDVSVLQQARMCR